MSFQIPRSFFCVRGYQREDYLSRHVAPSASNIPLFSPSRLLRTRKPKRISKRSEGEIFCEGSLSPTKDDDIGVSSLMFDLGI